MSLPLFNPLNLFRRSIPWIFHQHVPTRQSKNNYGIDTLRLAWIRTGLNRRNRVISGRLRFNNNPSKSEILVTIAWRHWMYVTASQMICYIYLICYFLSVCYSQSIFKRLQKQLLWYFFLDETILCFFQYDLFWLSLFR